MNQAISVELRFFLISILWGAIILLTYDVLRIFRRLIKHNTFILAVEDLIFWVIASIFIFAMIYNLNDGVIRGFSVMGVTIGMVLYHYILSEFLVHTITKLIQLLLSPFVFVINKIKGFLRFVLLQGKKASNFVTRRLKKVFKSFKITLDKRKQAAAAKRHKKKEQKALERKKKEELSHSIKEKKAAKKKKDREKQTQAKAKKAKAKKVKAKQQNEQAKQQSKNEKLNKDGGETGLPKRQTH